jgi:3',5'-cyclic-AMP phosphodiesterase
MGQHVLHVSDIHAVVAADALVYGQTADENLRRVIDAARARRPRFDAVVITGDVADDASPEAYKRVYGLLRPLGKILRWVPGNHDVPARMAEVDRDALMPTTLGSWRLLTLDSRWPGRTAGRTTAEAIRKVDAELGESDGSPCAVLVHHPPRPPCDDPDCQITEATMLVEVLERNADLRLVLSGHLHRGFTRVRGQICWSGAPSTYRQVDHPHHTHTAEPPAAHLLELGDDGSVLVSALHG